MRACAHVIISYIPSSLSSTTGPGEKAPARVTCSCCLGLLGLLNPRATEPPPPPPPPFYMIQSIPFLKNQKNPPFKRRTFHIAAIFPVLLPLTEHIYHQILSVTIATRACSKKATSICITRTPLIYLVTPHPTTTAKPIFEINSDGLKILALPCCTSKDMKNLDRTVLLQGTACPTVGMHTSNF